MPCVQTSPGLLHQHTSICGNPGEGLLREAQVPLLAMSLFPNFGTAITGRKGYTLMLRTKTEFTFTAILKYRIKWEVNIYLAIYFFHVNHMDFHCLNVANITKSHLHEGFA